ncbi:hypothetical protein BKA70DRAFT_861462 [Coprinopsis sp. MPI-PUGE-AT-0042]|nr:hypothetical protein BKA70DRAFT_861462 [Coprinopsis sp. MPI-PUGE-AT-0042]
MTRMHTVPSSSESSTPASSRYVSALSTPASGFAQSPAPLTPPIPNAATLQSLFHPSVTTHPDSAVSPAPLELSGVTSEDELGADNSELLRCEKEKRCRVRGSISSIPNGYPPDTRLGSNSTPLSPSDIELAIPSSPRFFAPSRPIRRPVSLTLGFGKPSSPVPSPTTIVSLPAPTIPHLPSPRRASADTANTKDKQVHETEQTWHRARVGDEQRSVLDDAQSPLAGSPSDTHSPWTR